MQLKYILLVVACFLVVSLLLVCDCFWSLRDIVSFNDPNIRRVVLKTFIFMAVKILSLSLFMSFLGLFLSNRIAGPIHRLSKDIITMSENADLTMRFSLREKDELTDIADALTGTKGLPAL